MEFSPFIEMYKIIFLFRRRRCEHDSQFWYIGFEAHDRLREFCLTRYEVLPSSESKGKQLHIKFQVTNTSLPNE